MKTIRWGIIATGWIAAKFAEACSFESRRTGKSVLAAVASRNAEKSAEFAKNWGIPRSYGSYEDLFADPDVDAVYIATPHHLHAELSIAALRSGKAVLCEKPVSITAREFLPVVETARETGLFFMEAMWMRFNPSFRQALDWVSSGRIGAVRYVRSDFFLDAPFDPKSRYYDPALGGGALLDLGIYPVTFATAFAGNDKPAAVSSIIKLGSTGVDLHDLVHLAWTSGLRADLSCAIDIPWTESVRSAAVIGESGSIYLPFFWQAEKAALFDADGHEIETFRAPFDCNGYEYEIREVEDCILCSRTESSVQTWADSVMVMETLDEIRTVAKHE